MPRSRRALALYRVLTSTTVGSLDASDRLRDREPCGARRRDVATAKRRSRMTPMTRISRVLFVCAVLLAIAVPSGVLAQGTAKPAAKAGAAKSAPAADLIDLNSATKEQLMT